jgi:hypothetical protein
VQYQSFLDLADRQLAELRGQQTELARTIADLERLRAETAAQLTPRAET